MLKETVEQILDEYIELVERRNTIIKRSCDIEFIDTVTKRIHLHKGLYIAANALNLPVIKKAFDGGSIRHSFMYKGFEIFVHKWEGEDVN